MSILDSNDLIPLRNYFLVGAYGKIKEESEGLLDLDQKGITLRDLFIYLSLIEQGQYDTVGKSVARNAPVCLQVVKLFAMYRKAPQLHDKVFETLAEWLSDATMAQDPWLIYLAAQMNYESGNYSEALRLVDGGNTLEFLGMATLVYLKINRIDLAQKSVSQMQGLDDDDAYTTLASAWVYLAKGGDKVQEAYEFLQELSEKFGESSKVLNLLAVTQIQLGNYTEAFRHLKQAREMAMTAKEPVTAETLINSIVCLRLLNKSEQIVAKITGELKQYHPNHEYFQQQKDLVQKLQSCAATYAK